MVTKPLSLSELNLPVGESAQSKGLRNSNTFLQLQDQVLTISTRQTWVRMDPSIRLASAHYTQLRLLLAPEHIHPSLLMYRIRLLSTNLVLEREQC